MTLAGVVVAGYLIGLVPLVWTLKDLGRSDPDQWARDGTPHPWRQAAWVAYLAAGWPVFVVAAAWSTSEVRSRTQRGSTRHLPHGVRSPHDL